MAMSTKLLKKYIDTLQYRQELHDQTFHSDIYTLSKPRRLTHLVLHHCKYVSELFLLVTDKHYQELQEKGPQQGRIERLTVDGLIICLSMANICNKPLFDALEDRQFSRQDAAEVLLRHVGLMAKTVEDIDHMAQTNPLGDIMANAAIMAMCYMSLYLHANEAPCTRHLEGMFGQLEHRLLSGERKNIHFREHIKAITAKMQQYEVSEQLAKLNMKDEHTV